MKCAQEGALRAFVDNELGRTERYRLEQHAAGCNACGRRITELAARAEEVGRRLASLGMPDESVDPALAYVQYRSEMSGRVVSAGSRFLAWWKTPQLSVAGAILALVFISAVTPARTWGQHFLQMLRVRKITVVPVDTSALEGLGIDNGRGRALSQLISDTVVVTMKPGEPERVDSPAEASVKAGFQVRTLDSLGAPKNITVQDGAAFHMTLDAERMRAVLEEAGRPDISIPNSVNGSVVAVHLPKGVQMQYGNCGTSDSCVRLLQIPSPVVSVPPNLNVEALAEAALQLGGMSASDARSFSESVNWTSTLVIPVPQAAAAYRTIDVDGVTGALIERAPEKSSRSEYELIWVKNGILYWVGGPGVPDQALAAVAGWGS